MTATQVTPPSITSIAITPGGSITPGTIITATVTYVQGTSQAPATQTLTGIVTDSVTGQTGQLTQTFTVSSSTISDPTTVLVADTGNHTWTKISDSGTIAIFTATA